MLREKGLTPKDEGSTVSLDGFKFASRTYFFAMLRLANDKFFEAALYYKTGSPNISDDFQTIKEGLESKYFNADCYSHFKYPYEKGDGHEESAISMGYGELSCYWVFARNAISIETVKVKSDNYIRLVYQDAGLVKEAKAVQVKESEY